MKPIILAVDSSKAIRFLMQSIFAKKYQLITAADASSAMYWLSRKQIPQLIISDVELPDAENWEFIANLKSSVVYKQIPTIVLSSREEAETISNCKTYGIDYHFLKPFNPVELVDIVDQLLIKVEIH